MWCFVWFLNHNCWESVIMWWVHCQPTQCARILTVWRWLTADWCSCISSLLQQQLTGDKLLALWPSGLIGGLRTWSTELTHRGGSGLVVDTAEAATFRHTPGRCAGPTVSLLGCIVDVHVRRALRQVFAVMAQAVLSDLDGVEVALWAPLSGQRNSWVEKRRIRT